MHYHPDADQRSLIADAFSRPLDEMLPIERLHRKDAAEPWQAIAELGIFGVAAPEEIGGVGLGPVEEALVAMELGDRLAAPGIFATLAALHCADDETRAQIVQGTCRVAPAVDRGGDVTVFDGQDADRLLVLDGAGAALAPVPAGAKAAPDPFWEARFDKLAGVPATNQVADATAMLRIRLILAAGLCGLARRALAMAVDYAKLREQFGHPIGGFQAIKHQCANMSMSALAAGDLTTFASVAVAEGREDATFQVEAALLLAVEAALHNARRNVQIHGGIGFSEEADPHLIVKRAHLLVEMAGSGEAAAGRVAAAQAPLH